MAMVRSLVVIACLAATAAAQDPPPVDLTTLTKREVTDEARARFDGYVAGVRFYEGVSPEGRVVLLAETERGVSAVLSHVDLMRHCKAVETPAQALALVRCFTSPPAGPPLVQFVELAPKLVVGDAEWVFSEEQVSELVGDGPTVTADPQEGFHVARVVVSTQRLAQAEASPGDEAALSPAQAEALKAPNATLHVLTVIGEAQEHVLPRNYANGMGESEARLLVVKTPRAPR